MIFAQPRASQAYKLHTCEAQQQAKVKKAPKRQAGQLSPFMFGLIMGMSIFSAMSLRFAQQELAEQQARNQQRAKEQAEDLAKALEFSVLAQTKDNYDTRLDLEKARQYASRATGQTRGGQDFIVVEREGEGETMGARNEVVAITGSDDTLRRSEVYRSGDARQLNKLASQNKKGDAVILLDTSGIRARQVQISQQNMEALAEHVYAFYAGHFRMPTWDEFKELNEKVHIRDAWNGEFEYSQTDNERATLTFNTPWGYEQSLDMSLKNDYTEASKEFERSREAEPEKTKKENATDVSSTTP